MKRYLLMAAAVFGLLVTYSCDRATDDEMSSDYPADYDIEYALASVKEYDDVNINGIDVYSYFDFFSTLTLTIHVKDGQMSSVEFDNGDVPFSPYTYDFPSGEVSCYFDSDCIPNALKLSSNDQVIAYYSLGELYIEFQLDCVEIDYQYRFKEIN